MSPGRSVWTLYVTVSLVLRVGIMTMQAGAKLGTASGWSLLHLAVALKRTEALALLAGKADSVNGEFRLHATAQNTSPSA